MMQDIKKLLDKYYEGETTLDEEKQLRQFFQSGQVPVDLQSHAAQFGYFTDARNEHPSLAFSNRLAANLQPETHRIGLAVWSMRIAAGVALLLLGFAAGTWYNRPQGQSESNYGMASAEPAPVIEMKKVLHFQQTAQTSASERIQAINQSYEIDQADQEITQLLINTMNFDDNINVRLAACQALVRFEHEPGVREALIQSLKVQTDPNMQITLIELLVSIKEKRAVDEMQRLVQSQQTMDVVRQKAEEGVNRLNRRSSSSAS